MTAPHRPPSGLRFGLALAVLVYVALRAAILVLAFESVALLTYEQFPMGTLPKALQLGGEYPLHLCYDNAAGQILISLLTWPVYEVCGDSYLALKLVPFTLGLLTLLCLWWLLRMLYGRRAADVGALLFALGPAELSAKYSLIASGNHYENLFFTTLAIATFVALHRSQRRRTWLLVSGFCAGLAVFVFLGALIPVGLLALAHLGARGRRGAARDLALLVPAGLLGAAPLLWLNVQTAGRAGDFLSAKFAAGGGPDPALILARLRGFLGADLFEAGFHGALLGLDWRVPAALLLGCFLLAWLGALPSALRGVVGVARGARGRGAELVAAGGDALLFVLYLPLAALAFGLSDMRIDRWGPPLEVAGFRYFLPTFLFGTVLIARLSADARGRGARALGLLLAGVAGATGLWNVRQMEWPAAEPRQVLSEPGHNFVLMARGLMTRRNAVSIEDQVRYASSFPPQAAAMTWRGVGFYGAQRQVVEDMEAAGATGLLRWVGEHPLDLDALCAGYPARVHPLIARGAGEGLRTLTLSTGAAYRALGQHLEGLVASGHPLAARVVEGVATIQDHPPMRHKLPRLLARGEALLKALPESLRSAHARGLGVFVGRLLTRDLRSEDARLRAYTRRMQRGLSPAQASAFFEGLGAGLVDNVLDPRWPAAERDVLPRNRLGEVARGWAQALRAVHGDAPPRALVERVPARLR